MNTIQTINAAIARKTAKFSVKLSNCGNPDYRQDYRRPLPDTICAIAHVDSLPEAAEICREYINFYELGGGNWNGGEIVDDQGVVIGRVGYNGRIWSGDGADRKELLCPA